MITKQLFYWQSAESITYHLLLSAHFYLLYSFMPPKLFGLMGTVFSSIYLLVVVINGGLDDSIAPLFASIRTDQQTLKTWIARAILSNTVLYSIVITTGYALYSYTKYRNQYLELPLLTLLALLLATESLKKSAKIILNLSLHIQSAVLGELGMMIGYIFLVWITIWHTGSVSLYHIFIPMLLCSSFELIFFGHQLYRWYKTVPVTHTKPITVKLSHFKLRAMLYLYNLFSLISSTNILIPIITLFYGLESAGQAKLVTSLVINGSLIVKKISETVSMVIFNQQKKVSSNNQKSLFNKIHRATAYPLLLVCSITCLYVWIANTGTNSQMYISLLCIIIPCLDIAFTAYKKWFIQQGDIKTLLSPYIYALLYGTIYLLSGIRYNLFQFSQLINQLTGVHILMMVFLLRVVSIVNMIIERRKTH